MLKQRPARVDPGKAIAELFPESMRKFGLAEAYGTCEGQPCSRRARATCPHCRGELCLAHATDGEHDCRPQSANAPGTARGGSPGL